MTASVPVLPPATGNLGVVVGAAQNTSLKQVDIDPSQAFGSVLEQAVAAVSEQLAAGQPAPSGAEQLLDQLQTLPEGGKLLPLLEQVMDGAVAAGAEPEQVLEQLAAKLTTLEQTTQLEPGQALATALVQVIDENPAYLGAAVPAMQPASRELNTLLQQLGIQDTGKPADYALPDRVVQDPKLPGPERTITALQQTLPGAQVQSDAATALAAFKQLTAAMKTAAPEPSARIETLTTALPAQQVVPVATNGATSTVPGVMVEPPLGHANWDQALSERVQWLVGQGVQRAQIRLNPAHLGPMEVRIQVQNDQASVQFTSAHAVVRDALDAALPRLREMLGASGVELVNVDVSSGRSFAEQQRTGQEASAQAWNAGTSGISETPETVLETPVIALLEAGRLDLFA